MNGLSNKQKKQFSEIIYSLSQREKKEQIQAMNDRTRDKFKEIVAQKIIYQTTKKFTPPPKDRQQGITFNPTKPGFISTVCCCLYPQDNRHNFDITTKIFLRRFFGVFLICKTNFLKFGIPKARKGKKLRDDPGDKAGILVNYNQDQVDTDGRNNVPDLYGPLWITIAYIIEVIICVNLNDYFIAGNDQYVFNTDYCPQTTGIIILFTGFQSMIYRTIIGCLKGAMSNAQSICLVGYSQILYFIPTVFCVIPSFYVHIIALCAGGLLKAIFLYRNYGRFLQSKRETLLVVFLLVELLYFYTMLRTTFYNYKSYSIKDGTNAVFGSNSHRMASDISHMFQLNLRRHYFQLFFKVLTIQNGNIISHSYLKQASNLSKTAKRYFKIGQFN